MTTCKLTLVANIQPCPVLLSRVSNTQYGKRGWMVATEIFYQNHTKGASGKLLQWPARQIRQHLVSFPKSMTFVSWCTIPFQSQLIVFWACGWEKTLPEKGTKWKSNNLIVNTASTKGKKITSWAMWRRAGLNETCKNRKTGRHQAVVQSFQAEVTTTKSGKGIN